MLENAKVKKEVDKLELSIPGLYYIPNFIDRKKQQILVQNSLTLNANRLLMLTYFIGIPKYIHDILISKFIPLNQLNV